jgi:hypothetical protein
MVINGGLTSGKHTKNDGTSPFVMGSYQLFRLGHFQSQTVCLPEANHYQP